MRRRFRPITVVSVLAIMLAVASEAAAAGSVTLAWDPNLEGNVSYRVAYGTQPGNPTMSVDVGSQTSANIGNLLDGQRYYFMVFAYVASAVSPPSSEVSAVPVVINQPPFATFTATAASGVAPLTENYNASGSIDPEGKPLTYLWNFGDGQSGTGVSVAHVYQAAGTFVTTLTVTDPGGAAAYANATITVVAPTIQPQPSPSPLAPPIDLTASVTNGTVTLRWTDLATGESGYIVERMLQRGKQPWTRVGVLPSGAQTFVDTTAEIRTNYSYRVAPIGSDGNPYGYSNFESIRVR